MNSDNTRRPLVSVLMPIHNASGYLARAQAQLMALDPAVDYEFVIIDDHSTDASYQIAADWGTSLPGPLIHLRSEKRGVAAARNEGLRHCSGDYVWMVDADDQWDPGIAATLSAIAEQQDADVVVCNAAKRLESGERVGAIIDAGNADVGSGSDAFARLLQGTLQGHLWNKLFRRTCLPDDVFPPTLAHSDLGGMLRLLPTVNRVAYAPEELYTYLQNPGSILNRALYDFDALYVCLEIAEDQCRQQDKALRDALTIFKYRLVLIPSFNELGRRLDHLGSDLVDHVTARARSVANIRDVPVLLRSGLPPVFKFQSLLAMSCPHSYVRLYRSVKRRQGQRLDS